ncbi:MAG TPA: SirB2 family protein [Steroidobacteraceae bacterium]|nr:SirB2 family protein [Steroidobacteraceae bacterium]HRX90276.1 SirB2 family protein [Steroidobacteraceae bacterium]
MRIWMPLRGRGWHYRPRQREAPPKTTRLDMQLYLPILTVHVVCALLTPWLFSARVYRAARGLNPAVGPLRWLPHTIDTVLLVAGVSLATLLRFSPLEHPWLAAKLVALLGYIVLGHIAVRRARSNSQRLGFWLAAMLTISYIYYVALTMDPVPFDS